MFIVSPKARHQEVFQSTISIVIVTYNRSKWIGQAIQSASSQTHPVDEILILDDGSSDDTQKVVREFSDKRIRYIKKVKNQGRPYARNLALQKAKGEYILWLDDDDILLPDTLKKYVNLLREDSSWDVIYGKLQYFDNITGNTIRTFDPIDWSENRAKLLKALLKSSAIPNPATIVRKSVYERAGEYDTAFTRAHDYEFWTRIAKFAKLKKLDDVVCLYRVHDDNVSYGELVDYTYESKIIRSVIHRYDLKEIFPESKTQDPRRLEKIVSLLVACSLFEYNDYFNAKIYFEKSPYSYLGPETLELLLKCYLFMGDLEGLNIASSELKCLPHIDKKSIVSFELIMSEYLNTLHTAHGHYNRNNFQEALQLGRRISKKFGSTLDSMLLMGRISERTGDIKRAFKLFKKAIACNPKNKEAIRKAWMTASTQTEKREILALIERLLKSF